MTLPADLKNTIEAQLKANPVVLYMKGEAESPMCGFSARAVAILNHHNIPFKDINILQDEDLRQGLKIYGDWPTFPQLYVNGQLVGGCDIMAEMHTSGEFAELAQTLQK